MTYPLINRSNNRGGDTGMVNTQHDGLPGGISPPEAGILASRVVYAISGSILAQIG